MAFFVLPRPSRPNTTLTVPRLSLPSPLATASGYGAADVGHYWEHKKPSLSASASGLISIATATFALKLFPNHRTLWLQPYAAMQIRSKRPIHLTAERINRSRIEIVNLLFGKVQVDVNVAIVLIISFELRVTPTPSTEIKQSSPNHSLACGQQSFRPPITKAHTRCTIRIN